MASHTFPTPDGTTSIPIWPIYACAQANTASVMLLPDSTLAFDVRLSDRGWTISLEFQVCEATPDDLEDMSTIFDRFHASTTDRDGGQLNITWFYTIVDPVNPVGTLLANNSGQVYVLYSLNPRFDTILGNSLNQP